MIQKPMPSSPVTAEQPEFSILRVRLDLMALNSIHLPPYSGSVFRGGFGAAFRRSCCTLRLKSCRNCLLEQSCPYALFFETSHQHIGSDKYKLNEYPRPFILEPPFSPNNHFQKGQTFSCGLTLLGPATRYLPYFIHAFSELGKSGIGNSRGHYRINNVVCPTSPEDKVIFDGKTQRFVDSFEILSAMDFFTSEDEASRITVTFRTPTRIQSRDHFVRELDFELLIINLLRRISLIVQVCMAPPWNIDYKAVIQSAAKNVSHSGAELSWYDWERFSRRQNISMKLGGFIGKINFIGDLKDYLPLLKLGEVLHIGKACTFGLGQYKMEVHKGDTT